MRALASLLLCIALTAPSAALAENGFRYVAVGPEALDPQARNAVKAALAKRGFVVVTAVEGLTPEQRDVALWCDVVVKQRAFNYHVKLFLRALGGGVVDSAAGTAATLPSAVATAAESLTVRIIGHEEVAAPKDSTADSPKPDAIVPVHERVQQLTAVGLEPEMIASVLTKEDYAFSSATPWTEELLSVFRSGPAATKSAAARIKELIAVQVAPETIVEILKKEGFPPETTPRWTPARVLQLVGDDEPHVEPSRPSAPSGAGSPALERRHVKLRKGRRVSVVEAGGTIHTGVVYLVGEDYVLLKGTSGHLRKITAAQISAVLDGSAAPRPKTRPKSGEQRNLISSRLGMWIYTDSDNSDFNGFSWNVFEYSRRVGGRAALGAGYGFTTRTVEDNATGIDVSLTTNVVYFQAVMHSVAFDSPRFYGGGGIGVFTASSEATDGSISIRGTGTVVGVSLIGGGATPFSEYWGGSIEIRYNISGDMLLDFDQLGQLPLNPSSLQLGVASTWHF